MIKIDKGVAVPPYHKGKKLYPFEKMEIGDSFLVTNRPRQQMSEHASRYGKRLGRCFEVRTVSEGVRVWRTK